MDPGNEPQGPNNGGPNQLGVLQDNLEQEELLNLYQVETPVGVAMGLGLCTCGGVPEYIKTSIDEQGPLTRGDCQLLGFLGNTLIESFHIAYDVATNIMLEKQPGNRFFDISKLRLQYHLEEALPRDGASAGCTMVTSLLSLAMNRPVRRNLAMTGAINLNGQILQIAGVREKTEAARRFQVTMLILPEANREEFEGLEGSMTEGLNARFVDNYNQVFELAFNYD